MRSDVSYGQTRITEKVTNVGHLAGVSPSLEISHTYIFREFPGTSVEAPGRGGFNHPIRGPTIDRRHSIKTGITQFGLSRAQMFFRFSASCSGSSSLSGVAIMAGSPRPLPDFRRPGLLLLVSHDNS